MCPGGVFFSKKTVFFRVWPGNVENRIRTQVSGNPGFIKKNQKNMKKRENLRNPKWQKVAKKGVFSG
jgi:hypothetical protein